jgi:hypothetical protein
VDGEFALVFEFGVELGLEFGVELGLELGVELGLAPVVELGVELGVEFGLEVVLEPESEEGSLRRLSTGGCSSPAVLLPELCPAV